MHRMAEADRDLLEAVWSNPPAHTGPPLAGCLSSRQLLNISKNGIDSTTPLGNLCPMLSHCHRKKSGSGCSEGISCGSACVHCLWFCHWAPVKTAWLCPLCALSQVFIHIDEISLNLLFSRLSNPNSPRLSWDRYSSPTIIFEALCWTLSSLFAMSNPELNSAP